MVDIWYGEFRVGNVSNGSGIYAGSNQQWKYKRASKQNQAFGAVRGQGSLVTEIKVRLSDRDKIDSDSSGPPPKP
ncbi:hypothetical protein COLU111180_09600 [Cohnella lubricantis]|uniref:Uncharacterized protein n=1 Tax=Cohnella lubricantis TaxID=2163172 RepID=A0A841TDX6_9BACL|nr:hypothetical protein [Cohnella lubricantis]MBB6678436.1 hypothetical protein [Cohnella lubricantis]MBP2116816.1 hypothetical protein [Cohnella lubricantis]